MEPGSSAPPGAFPPGGLTISEPRWRRFVPNLNQVVRRAMRLTGCTANVVLTDDTTLRRLNARDRGRNKPTNVLTYTYPPEILLAFGTVRREAAASRRPMGAHLSHLLVHGALHLAGQDHVRAGDARRMEQAEARLLAVLKIPNPWKLR